jgi:hypothetical protein
MRFVRRGHIVVNLDLVDALEQGELEAEGIVHKGQHASNWWGRMDELVPPAAEPDPSLKAWRDRPPML